MISTSITKIHWEDACGRMKGEGKIGQVFTSCGHTNHTLLLKWMKHFKTQMVTPLIYVTCGYMLKVLLNKFHNIGC